MKYIQFRIQEFQSQQSFILELGVITLINHNIVVYKLMNLSTLKGAQGAFLNANLIVTWHRPPMNPEASVADARTYF